MFTVTFKTDNAQFADSEFLSREIQQILRGGISLSSEIDAGTKCTGRVHDINGNTIGQWFYVPDGVVDAR